MRLKMRTRQANSMFKVHDNSALKRILGACWGARAIARHSSLSLYLCSFSRKAWGVKLVLCLQIITKIFYKMIVSLWVCIFMHAQSAWDNKFTISLQYLKKNKRWSWFLPVDNCQKFLQSDTIILDVCMPKLSKIKSFLFLCNILRKK